MNYSDPQKRAIATIDRNLQIIACAGSGKTQVISLRIVRILESKKSAGIKPENIVAFTFTEKAAGELKDRIQRLCLEHLGTDQGLAGMYVGTIHAYCLNLLQQPPVYHFLKYSVLTEVRQRLLIDRNSSKSGLTEAPLLDGRTLGRWVDSRLYQTLLSVLDEGGVKARMVPAAVREAEKKYRALMDEKKYLDYSGMLSRAVAEVKSNPKLREKIRHLVRYLVIDEYQDVNPLQEALIREIADLGANLCVVGDDDQTIYQWRGSDVQNIITFADRYANVKTERLNYNFRSSKGIVLTARGIIEQNPDRLEKKMESTDAQPFARGDILALQFANADEEARWIARKIELLKGAQYRDQPGKPERGLTYSDMAVLVRAWKDAGPIVDALREAEVPYLGGGMNSLFDTPEAQAIREVFYFLASHTSRDASQVTEASLRKSLENGFPGLGKEGINSGIKFLRGIRKRIPLGSDNQLFLQRVYLDLLEAMSIREERVGTKGRTGEVIFFNLGKFSQVISDFEHIHFHSDPDSLYANFAGFLEHQAADYYPEETQETAHARPDAVRVMTVHQAKGMQWPAVFIPCLRANRFPSRRQGGRSIWGIIPEKAVPNAERYKGTKEDERRLFYVALTRAEKYLFCSWGPIPNNRQQRKVSEFFTELTENEFVLGSDPRKAPPRLKPQARLADSPLPLTFSELRYYFQCPYDFKLRFLYGFDAPVNRALGFGKSLHDALCEIHAESIHGKVPTIRDVPKLVKDHLHLPFANDEVRENSVRRAERALRQYLKKHGDQLTRLEHAEKVIELKLAEGIVVSGRIDLIRRTDTDEIAIVDFKSGGDTQPQEMTRLQLQVYAAGYQKAMGKDADLIEIHNLELGHIHREEVEESVVQETLNRVVNAGRQIRDLNLPKHEKWCAPCSVCDMVGICRTRPAS
ncbi:MAG TPA: ATP-dependent DNA helicase [Terriglobia bacterium]|nr:ATP-dependent DNA helicase [Terriglobia bacterium]